ncbi:ubiquinone/menaquinone biosynthesis C-methyltransferase UbiE-like [Lineus longissimus]|uniref:ubiquinone/menaquinone biosynthesis C-methyltransferase UbiE-like n=1 Tax=Lineus longissimus TaxID=88925 RepID=UPI002B4D0539
MSTFTDYNSVSTNYDYGREATGAEYYIGALLTRLEIPLKDIHVLDAGCGTGNYSKMLLDRGVGKVTLLDGSEGMLAHAKKKCEGRGLAETKHHVLPTLPFPASSFDCVMFNNVLHHLESPGEELQAPKALAEAFRVLKPGGLLIIFNLMNHQFEKGFWFSRFLPAPMQRYKDGLPKTEIYLEALKSIGYDNEQVMVPLNLLLAPKVYFDEEGPLKQEFRSTHSFFSMTSPEELKQIQENLSELKRIGQLKDYVREMDRERVLVGQSCFFFATKPQTNSIM